MSNIVKTVITLEVLSEGPIDKDLTLQDIARETIDGSFSGWWEVKEEKELTKEQVVEECKKHGTEPGFFGTGEEEE